MAKTFRGTVSSRPMRSDNPDMNHHLRMRTEAAHLVGTPFDLSEKACFKTRKTPDGRFIEAVHLPGYSFPKGRKKPDGIHPVIPEKEGKFALLTLSAGLYQRLAQSVGVDVQVVPAVDDQPFMLRIPVPAEVKAMPF